MYSGYLTIIIELIDSICRDSTDTQYMIIQNKLSKSKKTISLYYKTISSSVFIINNTPSGAKKHRESTKPESHLKAKCFSFFFLFRLASSMLYARSFFCANSSILHWAVHQLIAFSLEVSQGGSNWSLKNYGFICNTIFFTCMHAYKSLSNKTIHYSRLLN